MSTVLIIICIAVAVFAAIFCTVSARLERLNIASITSMKTDAISTIGTIMRSIGERANDMVVPAGSVAPAKEECVAVVNERLIEITRLTSDIAAIHASAYRGVPFLRVDDIVGDMPKMEVSYDDNLGVVVVVCKATIASITDRQIYKLGLPRKCIPIFICMLDSIKVTLETRKHTLVNLVNKGHR